MATQTIMNQPETKIVILGTYFGTWPAWFPAFLLSCARNEAIHWLFFTDCDIPRVHYANITFEAMTLAQLNALASKNLGFPIRKDVFSQLNLRPAYGLIFDEYLKGYDFWGHCDFDVVWGDIRSFFTEAVLQNNDIVSGRKDFLSGHLTLWRNSPKVNNLFREVPSYREIFSSLHHHGFDEPIMSTFLRSFLAANPGSINVYWPEQLVVWYHGSIHPIGWYWHNGKVFDSQHRESIYMHFQHWNTSAWKSAVSSIDFQVGDEPSTFRITPGGIKSQNPAFGSLFRETLQRTAWKGSLLQALAGALRIPRFLKRMAVLPNSFWAKKLMASSVSTGEVRYERTTGNLYLKRFALSLGKEQHFLLDAYYPALQLLEQGGALFHRGNDQLFVEIDGLKFRIQNTDDILNLNAIFVDGKYNLLFTHPVVVLDLGMHAGLTSIAFASQPDAVVVGYEPCQKTYEQALHNISLNPSVAGKIKAIKAAVGDIGFKTVAYYYPDLLSPKRENRMGPEYVYEEVEIRDAAQVLDSTVTEYPGRGVVVKIDFRHPKYHIDGLVENGIIDKLFSCEKSTSIEAILLKWHKAKRDRTPPAVASQLSERGFKVILFSSHNPYQGMLYAVREGVPTLLASSHLIEEVN